MNRNRRCAAVSVLSAGMAAFLPRLYETQLPGNTHQFPGFSGMGNRNFHVIRQLLAALGIFLGNHFKNAMPFVLRLLRRVANRMTAVNRWNIGNKTSVVVRAANNMIIEKRFHNVNLAHKGRWEKWKNSPSCPGMAYLAVREREMTLSAEADLSLPE